MSFNKLSIDEVLIKQRIECEETRLRLLSTHYPQLTQQAVHRLLTTSTSPNWDDYVTFYEIGTKRPRDTDAYLVSVVAFTSLSNHGATCAFCFGMGRLDSLTNRLKSYRGLHSDDHPNDIGRPAPAL